MTGYLEAYLFEHPDYGKARIDRHALYYDKNVVVPLLKTGAKEFDRALYGTVVDPNDNPVEGAKVEVTRIVRGHLRSLQRGKTVYTNEKGWFTFYPPGQKKNTDIPAKAKYGLRIIPPKKTNLPVYTGLQPNGQELKIVLKPRGHYHTFTFETSEGRQITDDRILDNISIEVKKTDGMRKTLNSDYFKDGAVVPLGTYTPVHKDMAFIPLKVTKERPQNIVFRQDPDKKFTGRVVYGITGEPMKGAFVIQSTTICSEKFSEITEGQWNELHQLGQKTDKKHDAVEPLRKIRRFDYLLRTGDDGRFEIKNKHQNFYHFIVFEQNFMPFSVRVNSNDVYGKEQIELGDIKLFPAARVKIQTVQQGPSSVMPIPVIADNTPKWARVFKEHVGFSYDHWHGIKQPQLIYVPAGVKFKLKLKPSGNDWDKLLIDKPIYLEQGQILDLGTVEFMPTIELTVKVVDPQGKPLEGFLINRYHKTNRANYHLGFTDTKGQIQTVVYPSQETVFIAEYNGKTVKKLVTAGELSPESELVIVSGK